MYCGQCGLCWWVKQLFVCFREVLHMVTNSFRSWVKRKVGRTSLAQFSFAEHQEAQLLKKTLALFLKQNLLLSWGHFLRPVLPPMPHRFHKAGITHVVSPAPWWSPVPLPRALPLSPGHQPCDNPSLGKHKHPRLKAWTPLLKHIYQFKFTY